MHHCIKVLPQAQNKSLFPQSRNQLNAVILRERSKKIWARSNKTNIFQAGPTWYTWKFETFRFSFSYLHFKRLERLTKYKRFLELNPKFFIVSGTIDQMLRARYDIVSVPYFKKLALLLRNVLQFFSS